MKKKITSEDIHDGFESKVSVLAQLSYPCPCPKALAGRAWACHVSYESCGVQERWSQDETHPGLYFDYLC